MASRLDAKQATVRRIMLRCWGDFALQDADSGADLKPRGRKARALIAYLVMHPGKPVSRDRLMGLLWGDRADEQARASLRQTLFELRDFSHGDRPLLNVDREAVALAPDAATTDIDTMAALLAAGDYRALLDALPEADDALFANLDGIDPGFDEWLAIERTRQRDALTAMVADASAGALAVGRARTARALHARLLEFNPEERSRAPSAAPTPEAPSASVAATPAPPARRTASVAAALLLATGAIAGVLWYGAEVPKAARTNEDAQGLYETAHEVIYQRKGAEYPLATQLLRRALALEPNHVPAMADLAAVLAMSSPGVDDHPEADRLARRAVQLDPDSAIAQGTLGMVLGFQSDEARAAIKRAARLDPRDPQIQFWLSNVLSIEGDYVGRLQALRRAVAADPNWHRATGVAAMAAWELGYREEADVYAAKLREIDPRSAFLCDYAIDWARGDYSGVVRDTLAVRERLDEADAADWKLGMALLVLGHEQPARLLLRLPPPLWRIVSGAGPAPGELEPLLIAADRDTRADAFSLTALREMLKAGRAAEIVSAYDRRVGRLAGLADGSAASVTKVTDGLQVALALRTVGRNREAAALLDQADAAVRQSASHGAMPNWMYAGAASIWAAQGRKTEALAALQVAVDRGWQYAPLTPLPDMGDIPSLESLRGDPRFERLRQRLKDHIRQERDRLGAVPVLGVA